MSRVIVVGAGVSGLSAAFRLQQQGHEVTVLEAEPHVGGKTAATRRDGFILNTGATVLGASYDAMLALAREAGVESQVVRAPATIGIVRDGAVHRLRGAPPGAIVDFLRTPLLSARSKLLLARAGLDAFRARGRAGYDHPELRAELDTESIADYCARRLNDEIRDVLLGPVMGGLYVTDGTALSVADLHFTLTKILAGGMLGYRGGIDFYARALAKRLDVRTGCRVTHVEGGATSARVVWDGGEETVEGVVLTVAAPLVPALYPGLDPAVQGMLLEGLQQADYISVRLALRRRPDEDAMLVVVPSGELGGIATVMFEHHISEGCAPEGKGLVGVLLYHEWASPRLGLSDDALLEALLPDLDRLVPGVAEAIEFAQITRWAPGAPRAVPGTHRLMADIVARTATGPGRRVQLAGDYLSIPSINGSVVPGEAAALRLAAALGA